MARTALTLVFLFGMGAFSPADELNDFRDRQQLLTQKWGREVGAAIETSRRLERTDPASAREITQSALGQLRGVAGLNEAVRRELTRRLEIRLLEIDRARPATAAPPSRPTPKFVAPAPSLVTPGSSSGKLTDATRSFIDRQRSQLERSNETRQERASGFSGTISGIQSSAIPSDEALTLSPNHKDLIARRQPNFNPKEEAVMKALGSSLQADFTGMNLRQVFDYLAEKTGLMIIPDTASFKEANVELDDPVTFKVNAQVAVRTILRKILGDRGLAYVVQEGGLSIVTTQKARESTVVRIYPINDLVSPIQPQPQFVFNPLTGGFVPAGPGTPFSPNRIMGQTIVDLVKSSVDPSYWAPTGPGSVGFHEATGALIVRASAEIHFMIGNALYRR